ncbi:serine threonine protein [Ceraceosorus bombacis]|uniref:non-specific serine/threonine protein kinase n=1 Tax=Ceraceosorus bombacis TaxID=401625 RepID=A0A0P1BDX5_9BASI|nr:serine threonine protein [Ceraceosorus bombacis]
MEEALPHIHVPDNKVPERQKGDADVNVDSYLVQGQGQLPPRTSLGGNSRSENTADDSSMDGRRSSEPPATFRQERAKRWQEPSGSVTTENVSLNKYQSKKEKYADFESRHDADHDLLDNAGAIDLAAMTTPVVQTGDEEQPKRHLGELAADDETAHGERSNSKFSTSGTNSPVPSASASASASAPSASEDEGESARILAAARSRRARLDNLSANSSEAHLARTRRLDTSGSLALGGTTSGPTTPTAMTAATSTSSSPSAALPSALHSIHTSHPFSEYAGREAACLAEAIRGAGEASATHIGGSYSGAGMYAPPLSAASSASGGYRNESQPLSRPRLPAGGAWRSGESSAANSYASSVASGSGSNRRQGAMRQGSGGEMSASDDGVLSGANLARAKSVSSVSSVTSSSSMEAVPFRAAPLGGVREGFGGFNARAAAQSRTLPRSAGSALIGSGWPARRSEEDAEPSQTNASLVALSPTKLKHTPKGPSDAWLFRNAPGLGSTRGARPIPGAPSSSIEPLRSLFAPSLGLSPPDGDSAPSTSPTRTRASSAIRSKLAKSAGKLGLKPLTVMPNSGHGQGSPAIASLHSSNPVERIGAVLNQAASGSSSTPKTAEDSLALLTPVPDTYFAHSGPRDGSSSFLPESMMRTSSVTNAPLVVPKHPPGPPGTGPPPSPGLIGMASPSFMLRTASPRISPRELADDVLNDAHGHHLRGGASAEPGSQANDTAASPSSAALQRDDTLTPEDSAIQAMFLAQHRSASASTIGPGLTPAQLVQQQAQAGVAVVPSEPSGDTPGPSPASPALSPLREHPPRTGSAFLTPASARHHHNNSGSSGGTAVGSLGTVIPRTASPSPLGPITSRPRRPGLLRALTSEGAISRKSTGETSPTSPNNSSSPNSLGPHPLRPSRSKRAIQSEESVAQWKMPGRSRGLSGSSSGTGSSKGSSSISSAPSGAMPPAIQAAALPSRSPPIAPDVASTNPFAAPFTRVATGQGPMGEDAVTDSQASVAQPSLSAIVASSSRPPLPGSLPSSAPSSAITIDEEAPLVPIRTVKREVAAAPRPPPFPLPEAATSAVSLDLTEQPILAPSEPATVTAPALPQLGAISEHPTAHVSAPDFSKTTDAGDRPPLHAASSLSNVNTPQITSAPSVSEGDAKGTNAAVSSQQASQLHTPVKSSTSPGTHASQQQTRTARGRDDFEFGEVLGEGSYSTVIEAWDLLSKPSTGARDSFDEKAAKPISANAAIAGAGSNAIRSAAIRNEGRKRYAVKVLDKVHILKEKKQKYVAVEKEALSLLLRHPGVITLYWTFQDRDSLYFVLELAPKGELLGLIKQHGSLDSLSAAYFAAQLVDVISGMHAVGVVHRDIKPENVLLDAQYRIRMADFGSASIQRQPSGKPQAPRADVTNAQEGARPRTSSFVGTAEYVSPELLTEKAATHSSDWWAFGCVLYQMIAGRPPFKGPNEYQTFQRIIKREYEFPEEFPDDAKDLVEKLLVLDPAQRLGTGPDGVQSIKGHAFFRDVDWSSVWTCPVPDIQAGIFRKPIPATRPPQFASGDGFGSDAWAEGSMDSTDEEESAGHNRDASRSAASSDAGADQSARSLASEPGEGGQEADDDDSSDDEAPRTSRRRNTSSNRLSSNILRVAANIAGAMGGTDVISTGSAKGKVPQARNSISGLRATQNRFSTASLDSANSSPHSSNVAFPTTTGGQEAFRNAPDLQAQVRSWAALLLPQEALLFAGPVIQRKTGAFRTTSRSRQLLLTDFPRLLCVKETEDQLVVKSEVILAVPRGSSPSRLSSERQPHSLEGAHSGSMTATTPSSRSSLLVQRRDSSSALSRMAAISPDAAPNFVTAVEAKGSRAFVVHTPARTYLYEDSASGDATHWIRSIRAAAQRS